MDGEAWGSRICRRQKSATYHILMLGLADGDRVGKISGVVDMLGRSMLASKVRYIQTTSLSIVVVLVCTHEFSSISIISKQPGAMLLHVELITHLRNRASK